MVFEILLPRTTTVCFCLSLYLSVCLSVCLSVGVSVSMAGFLAGESLCQDGGLSESVVDCAMRVAEQKQQQANTATPPSHGKCSTRVVVTQFCGFDQQLFHSKMKQTTT